ncbi:DUF5590 domain-containing protein [Paenibacillus sp. IB182496]|uniref:DUF5590 domain-containing protein n=1 Tax=Paenibacillus sabuli TaxID=2772509 RepID=A0A927BSI4_9BACL|nr:DUF5590 domain-containing protein [Paenibacillus sabuli]MBD2845121.1 DUF5590 domain-containing protein [Paenibacillus sabuli]
MLRQAESLTRGKRYAARRMNIWRWVIAAGIVLLLVLLVLNLYYRSVQAGVWAEEREVRELAMESAGLTQVNDVTKHVWDQTAWVVRGIDTDGRDVWVWLVEGEVQTLRAEESVTAARARELAEAQYPDARVLRVLPGLLGEEKAWEVYFHMNGESRTYHYAFYRFSDGAYLTTYNLPSRFAD